MPLLDASGQPIPPTNQFAKSASPIAGEAFAPRWAGDIDKYIFTMPGGGTVMFDLSRLTLADFRTMRDHYQVSATLNVLTFMMHQMDWKIECDNKKIATQLTENISNIWTQLIRAISQSFWAGYSPNVLQWENGQRYLELTKIKDLIPEECCVDWADVEGWAPPDHIKPKIKIFNGIKVWGQNWPVPVDNSFWYPLMMENGDYYGRKLLRPVFTSWYFSILVHLFSNRYFERFGEPIPVGRASYEEEITVPTAGGPKKVNGADLMVSILQNLRNRSVVVLPNDRSPTGNGTQTDYDYNIEYLESQMRGADFERYLMRLDEEISLGLFTPLLILRTADVGSYNLGSTHWTMYLNMLHALSSDAKAYIDNFILSRLVDYNWGVNAPRAKIVFRKMGDDRKDLVIAMLQALVAGGRAKADMKQLGDIAGLTLEEIQQVTTPPGQTDPNKTGDGNSGNSGDSNSGGSSSKGNSSSGTQKKKAAKNSRGVLREVASRVAGQYGKFSKGNGQESFVPSFGFERQLDDALDLDGAEDAGFVRQEICRITALALEEVMPTFFASLGVEKTSDYIYSMMETHMQELLDAGR